MSASTGARAVVDSDATVVRFSTADYPPHERVEALLHEIFGRNLQKVHVAPLDERSGSFHTEVPKSLFSGSDHAVGGQELGTSIGNRVPAYR